ncbi:MAG: hypothetical protein HUJ68_12865 [Clostridia bacterium]|nr:hypothetical protein [Clostridia bacterium]
MKYEIIEERNLFTTFGITDGLTEVEMEQAGGLFDCTKCNGVNYPGDGGSNGLFDCNKCNGVNIPAGTNPNVIINNGGTVVTIGQNEGCSQKGF